jgi:ribose 5-phosphate isomerase A
VSDPAKRAAADAAVALVEDGMTVGLGSGTTMRCVVAALGARVRAGLRLTGVPTSAETAGWARDAGIALAAPAPGIDLALDGADEIERGTLRLIKGLGGALLREKIVAELARRFVVVADESKLVATLGARAPLPVEVDPVAAEAIAARLAALGGAPRLRTRDGAPVRTDGGHFILDCPGFAPIRDPFTLERQLRAIAGVLATGLFLLPVECALIGRADGSVHVERAA